MEIVSGEPLTAYLERHGERLRHVFRQVALGLQTLHDGGVLHCDIKPSNVLVDGDGRVVLLDFGLARRLDPAGEARGLPMAITPDYAAPELLAGASHSAASDWYAVGVMLYRALAGQLPFPGSAWEAAPAFDDLGKLTMGLLCRDPAGRPSAAEILAILAPGAPPAEASPPGAFVGREEQIRLIEEVFTRLVARGLGAAIHVSGVSGIGKTALVEESLAVLDKRTPGLMVFRGRCHEGESVPYKTLDEMVDQIRGFLQSLPAEEASRLLPSGFTLLARLFPVLEAIIPAGPEDSEDSPDQQQLRRQAFGAFRELLVKLAGRGPVVLFLDDLQWGDLDSALLLRDLMDGDGAPAILLLLAYRPDTTESGLELLRAGAIQEIALGPLEPSQSLRLAESLLEERGSAAGEIAHEAGGSPFFLRQLAVHARKGGSRGSLQEVIHQRRAALSEPEQRFLEVLAIARTPLGLPVLRDAAGLGDQILSVRTTLMNESLIRNPGTPHSACDMYHDRIGETIAAEIPAGRRRDIHERLALALEAHGDPDAEAIALHFHGAGLLAQACSHGRSAAERAAAALAFDRAARIYRNVIEWAAQDAALLPLTETSALERACGDALVNCGRGVEAARAFARAMPGSAPPEVLRLRIRFAAELLRSGEVAEGLAAVRQLLREYGLPYPDTRPRAIARLIWERLRLAWTRVISARLIERPPVEHEEVRMEVCWAAAVGTGMTYPLLTEIYCAIFLRLALRAGDRSRLAVAWSSHASRLAYVDDGELREARALMRRAEQFLLTDGSPYAEAFVADMWATIEMLGGNWRKSGQHAARSRQIFRERCVGVTWEVVTVTSFLLSSRTLTGDWQANARELPLLIQEARDHGDRYAEVTLRLVTGFYSSYLIEDKPDEAEAIIEQCAADWPRGEFDVQRHFAVQGLVDLDLYRGRAGRAWQRLRQVWPELERSGLLRLALIQSFAVAQRGRAALALAASDRMDGGERRRLLAVADGAARSLLRSQARYAPGLGRIIAAGAAWLRDDRDTARDHLRAAESELEAAELIPWLAVVRLALAKLLDGAAADRMREAGMAWMNSQQVRRPECLLRMLFPSASSPSS